MMKTAKHQNRRWWSSPGATTARLPFCTDIMPSHQWADVLDTEEPTARERESERQHACTACLVRCLLLFYLRCRVGPPLHISSGGIFTALEANVNRFVKQPSSERLCVNWLSMMHLTLIGGVLRWTNYLKNYQLCQEQKCQTQIRCRLCSLNE